MAAQKTSWKKILYQRQPFPDNYVDSSFLDELKKNVNTRIYDLPTVIFESGVVSQQLSSVILFVVAFIYMDMHIITPDTIMISTGTLSLFGYVFCKQPEKNTGAQGRTVQDDLKSMFIFCTFVSGLSPLLWTLTDTISTDTIYAMTTVMLASNLLFHDYGAGSAIVSKAVSLNASIFAAICLGSRLPSAWHVTTTAILAMQMFALLPILRTIIKERFPSVYVASTALMVILSVGLLVPVSKMSAFGLLSSHLCITFVFPLWMIKLQKLKNNIHGPWDEAMIKG